MELRRLFESTCPIGKIVALVLGATGCVMAAAGAPPRVAEEDLGVPIHSVTIPAAAIGPDGDGGYLLYVVANGSPAVFTVVEVPSGRQVHSEPLAGVHSSWSLDVAGDGSVYIGTNRNGHLYRWRPGDEAAESVAGSRVAGETHLYGTVAAADGWIYNGSYPNGKVFRHDPRTGETRDYGQVVPGVNYVRNLAVEDGTIYAATFPEVHLVAIDAATGAKRELPLPPGRHEVVSHLTVAEELLFARVGNRLWIFDPVVEEWIAEGPSMAGFSWIARHESDRALFLADEQFQVHRFDFQTGEFRDIGLRLPSAPRSFAVLRLDPEKYPGYTLAGSGMRGDLWTFNLETGELKRIEAEIDGVPITIRSMTSGPDGNVYVAGYLSPRELARFDPDRGAIEKFPWGAQLEAMFTHRGRVFMGRYPRASVLVYDPEEPVSRNNPKTLFDLNDYSQDRPFAFAADGDLLAVGTVPKAGILGGVLAIYNLSTGELEVHEDVVPDQSIVSLAWRDGLLYGGTTVWGGLGIEPVAQEAKLFVWDVEQRKKRWEGTPVKGERAVSDLAFDSTGTLWGITAATIFRFDPRARTVSVRHRLYPHDWTRTFWQSSFLEYDAARQLFFGTAAGRFFRFDPNRDESDILATSAGYFARDRYGDFYFSRGANLVRARVEDR